MIIKINGKPYNKANVHQIFSQAREYLTTNNIKDEHNYKHKALFYTELFVHLLGSIKETSEFIDPTIH